MKLQSLKFSSVEIPKMMESVDRNSFVKYGADNLYPNYLISLYNNSPINKAVIDTKTELITGSGIRCKSYPMAVVNFINDDNETIEEVFQKCALDFQLFGGFALNIIWTRDREQIAEIYHLDFSRVRCGKMDEDDHVDQYHYSHDWSNVKKYPIQSFDRFNQKSSDPSQILYYKSYSPNTNYYPIPSYSGCINAISIEAQIFQFHKSNLENNLNPGLWVNMNNGIPDDEEQMVIMRSLEEQYGGATNSGRPIISFNESKEQAPEIVQIPRSDNDSYYSVLIDNIQKSILSGHRVSSPELFGIMQAGKLGSGKEIVEHSEYFRLNVIVPIQNEMLKTFNKVMSIKFQQPIRLEITQLSLAEYLIKEEIKQENNEQ